MQLLLPLIILTVRGVLCLPTLAPNSDVTKDGEVSRKILGSSVVTSVSVIMNDANDSSPYFSDAVGKPMAKPNTASQIASPINLLNPDRYEFFTFDDNGDLVKRLMTIEEIQGIIASSDSNSTDGQHSAGNKVNDIVTNVQQVLQKEIEAHKDSSEKIFPEVPQLTSNWHAILHPIFSTNLLDENKTSSESSKISTLTTQQQIQETTSIKPVSESISPEYLKDNESTNVPLIAVEIMTKETVGTTENIRTTFENTEKLSTVTELSDIKPTTYSPTSTPSLINSETTELPTPKLSQNSETTIASSSSSLQDLETISSNYFGNKTATNSVEVQTTTEASLSSTQPERLSTFFFVSEVKESATESNTQKISLDESTITYSSPLNEEKNNGEAESKKTTSLPNNLPSTRESEDHLTTLEELKVSTTSFPVFSTSEAKVDDDSTIQAKSEETVSEQNNKILPEINENSELIAEDSTTSKRTTESQSYQYLNQLLQSTNAIEINNELLDEGNGNGQFFTTESQEKFDDASESKGPLVFEKLSTIQLETTASSEKISATQETFSPFENVLSTQLESKEIPTIQEEILTSERIVTTREPTVFYEKFVTLQPLTISERVSTTQEVATSTPSSTILENVSSSSENLQSSQDIFTTQEAFLEKLSTTERISSLTEELFTNQPSLITTTGSVLPHTTVTAQNLATEDDEKVSQSVNSFITKEAENNPVTQTTPLDDDSGNITATIIISTTENVLLNTENNVSNSENHNEIITTEKIDSNVSQNGKTTVKEWDEDTSKYEENTASTLKEISSTELSDSSESSNIEDNYKKIAEDVLGPFISVSTGSSGEYSDYSSTENFDIFTSTKTISSEATIRNEQSTIVEAQTTELSIKENELTSTLKPVEEDLKNNSVTTQTIKNEDATTIFYETTVQPISTSVSSIKNSESVNVDSTTADTSKLENLNTATTPLFVTVSTITVSPKINQATENRIVLNTTSSTTTTVSPETTWTLVSTVLPQKTLLADQPTNIKVPNSQPIPTSVDLVPQPIQGYSLEDSTSTLDPDMFQFSELCNEIAFSFWGSVTTGISFARSVIVSPFATTSMLAMVFLGARGATSGEMNEILKLDDMVTFNPHTVFKNVIDSIEVSKKSGVAVSVFVKELYSDKNKGRLLKFYKDRVKQFYDGHVEEVNFREINDVIRRRTNLLIRRQTWGKIPEFLKDNNLYVRPPLAAVSANIFETDCSEASSEGRDGELHFVVLPSIRQRKLVPIPAVVYRSGFLAGYDAALDATAVAIGTKDHTISTVFVIPGQQGISAPGDGLIRLENRLIETAYSHHSWNRLLRSLIPRPGLEVQIPRFSHKSIINATMALQRMGLKELFSSHDADLKGLNGIAHEFYLSDVVQVNTFATCGEGRIGESHHSEIYPATTNRSFRRIRKIHSRQYDINSDTAEEPRDYQRAFHDPLFDPSYLALPLQLRPRQARVPDAPRLRFDRPFLYFVRHNPTGLILHMGRFNPRLLA